MTAASGRPGRARAVPPTLRLVVVHPRELAGVHALTDEPTEIGRQPGPDTTLVLAHPTVSRRHVAILWDPVAGRHAVIDRGSHNGTFLDGKPIGTLPKFMADGSVLRIGDVLAVYERGEATTDPPEVNHDAIPGRSLAVQQLRAAVARVAPERAPALISGETGAGKENIAGELHRLGRPRGPFLTVNCAAISPQLFESQLFGHVRGAFTGATHDQPGLLRAATGGTLFLDELGELPLDLQPKLLRAVELGEVIAVGSTQRATVDVRVVAATNRSLAADIDSGKFRRDLHARLALFEIQAPPLRARRADLLGWIDRLHRAIKPHAPLLTLDPEAAEALLLAPWPDNLRGLQRLVHGLPPAATISRESLPAWLSPAAQAHPEQPDPAHLTARARPTREELLAALAAHGWSLRATAKHYARDRKQIARWVEMYAIDIPARPGE
jgi:DNA-binding NtrC family response regulator